MRSARFLPLLLLVVGCAKGNFNDRKASSASVLTYPISAKVTTLDPGKVQDVDMGDVLGNVFEGLVAYDEQNKLAPRLAEKWEFKDGGRTIVFHLRPAKFQNGRTVTADDFIWSWKRNLGKPLNSPVASDYLAGIVGVAEFADGKASDIPGVKALDEKTLQVTLDKPRPYFLGNLTYPCTFVMAKEAAKATEMRSPAEAVGTGPFKMTRVADDIEVDLEAFADYWEGKPKIEKIARPIVVDPATQLSRYRNGEFDIMTLQRQDVENVRKDPKLAGELQLQPRPAIFYFMLNQLTYKPFRDERVRKAFALTLNRQKIVGDLLEGKRIANGLVPPGVMGYQEGYKGLPYDPETARKLLAAAGYPGGKGLPTLELTYREGKPDARLACEAAATGWKRDLGAPVQPRAMQWAALLERRNRNELDMTLSSWFADYLDPQNFLSLIMSSTSAMSHDGFHDPVFDDLCARADVEQDEAKRVALYQEAERRAVEEAARLPLYYEQEPVLISKRVRGVRSNLFGLMPHTKVEVAR